MKIKLLTMTVMTATLGLFVFANFKAIAYDVLQDACVKGPDSLVCEESKKEQTPENNSFFGPNGLFTKAAGLITILVGIASVVMIIVGGIRYAMSSGDSSNINGAKNTILYALIGLVVALVAQGIIVFVVKKL